MSPYVLLISYTFFIIAIAIKWGIYMERNRQAKMRKSRPHRFSFNPSVDITFN